MPNAAAAHWYSQICLVTVAARSCILGLGRVELLSRILEWTEEHKEEDNDVDDTSKENHFGQPA